MTLFAENTPGILRSQTDVLRYLNKNKYILKQVYCIFRSFQELGLSLDQYLLYFHQLEIKYKLPITIISRLFEDFHLHNKLVKMLEFRFIHTNVVVMYLKDHYLIFN